VLALSGGGAGGAFAAGALIGMTRRGDRLQFDVVTGVSAGALVAPFAFLGVRSRCASAFPYVNLRLDRWASSGPFAHGQAATFFGSACRTRE
jgi:predicted patatin/cPLA2 family phospholipase